MNSQNTSLLLAALMGAFVSVQGSAQTDDFTGAAMFETVPQVEVEAKFIAFTKSHVDALIQKESGGCVSVETLQELFKDGKARILFAPRLMTKSGANAEVKAVTECIYPTDFMAAGFPVSGSNETALLEKTLVMPADFQVRDVGVILNVTPVVSADGNDIELVLMPQIVCEPVWKDYGSTYIDASGRQQQVKMEQPLFSSRVIATAITVENGGTVLLGGGMNFREDDEEVVYVFVTARTVDNQGKPTK